jgi:Arc/MetJ-type ribon-helix-helix transcriptional regulator
MVKTQVRIPDELYKQAKRVARDKEWSFSEVVRRGLEYMTQTNPRRRVRAKDWRLPLGRHCGKLLAPPEEWTDITHDL